MDGWMVVTDIYPPLMMLVSVASSAPIRASVSRAHEGQKYQRAHLSYVERGMPVILRTRQ